MHFFRVCLVIVSAAILSSCGGGVGNTEISGSVERAPVLLAASLVSPAPTIAMFYAPRSSYTIAKTATGFSVTDSTGAEAVRNVGANTRLHFTDIGVALDLTGAAGKTYRLYQAAFNRKPDLGGLSFWLAQMDNGTSLSQLSAAFIGSGEFAAMYGATPSVELFVANLYNNVLHRTYDQAGFDFWVGQIKAGGTRQDILAAFSESSENVEQTGVAIANGVEFTPAPSSFSLMQSKLFSASCTSCHSAALPTGGLALDARAFPNLVNVMPISLAAANDGFKLVAPGNPDKSLLYQKLLMWDPLHSPRYGAAMPLGSGALSVGQIEFVKRWIAAGAPETGTIADAALLDDKTVPTPITFTPLAPPPAGQGYQITTGLFTVAPDFERELFIYRKLGNASPIYISRFESKMRNNSHHLLMSTFNANTPSFVFPPFDVIRDIREPNGSMNFLNMLPMGYHTFFAGSMTVNGGYTFPAGVALRLPANAALDLNSHFVNTGTSEILGEAYVNFYTMDAAQVQHTATTLDLGNTSMVLQPNTRSTISKSFLFSKATTVLMLTSHTHARGERFVIRIKGGARDGEIVYNNIDWESPQIVTFNPPITLKSGEGLTSEITYNNTTNRVISFGLSSEDEMGIIFGYVY